MVRRKCCKDVIKDIYYYGLKFNIKDIFAEYNSIITQYWKEKIYEKIRITDVGGLHDMHNVQCVAGEG